MTCIWYHLHRSTPMKDEFVKPWIPSTANPKTEDTKTPRICVSDSIDGCLSSLQCDPGKYYVYSVEIDLLDPILHYPSPREVFDAFMTHEVWILAPVKFQFEGIIYANDDTMVEYIPCLPGASLEDFPYRRCSWKWIA